MEGFATADVGGVRGLAAGDVVCVEEDFRVWTLEAIVVWDSLSGERVGVRRLLLDRGALGGERLALARSYVGGLGSGGGCGARGAALLGASGCLTMLLAEAFSVVALRHDSAFRRRDAPKDIIGRGNPPKSMY